MTNKGKTCKVCGNAPAIAKGMCRKCYQLEYIQIRKHRGVLEDRRSEQTKQIITDYALGNKTQVEIAEKYGVSKQWVNKAIKAAGIKKC